MDLPFELAGKKKTRSSSSRNQAICKMKKTPYDPSLPHGYPEDELYDCLRRAHIDNKMSSVSIDSRRDRFLYTSLAWGQEKKLLAEVEEDGDEQSTVWTCRFTDKAKEELLKFKTYEEWKAANTDFVDAVMECRRS